MDAPLDAGMRAAFNFFDKDGSGAISMDELGDALRLKGFNPTSKELVKLGRELDTDRSGEIEFNEFVVLCEKLGSVPKKWQEMSDKCMAAFKKLDKNGDGFISCIEFRVALAQRPVPGKVAPVEEMIEAMDLNGDGKIDYGEYLTMLGKTKDEVEELLAISLVQQSKWRNVEEQKQELDAARSTCRD
eukprot:gene7396-18683_t